MVEQIFKPVENNKEVKKSPIKKMKYKSIVGQLVRKNEKISKNLERFEIGKGIDIS